MLSPNRLAEIYRYHSLQMTPIVRRAALTRPHLSMSTNGESTTSELYAMMVALTILLFIVVLVVGTLVIKCLEISRTAASNAQRRVSLNRAATEPVPKSVYGAIYLL